MSRKLLKYSDHELTFGLKSTKLSTFTNDYKQPLFIYDLTVIEERINWIKNWKKLGQLHYAVKANFNLEILKLIKKKSAWEFL